MRNTITRRTAATLAIEPYARGYTVVGVAYVQAAPYRAPLQALDFARRIAIDPAGYLDALAELQVPGVVDLRPFTTPG